MAQASVCISLLDLYLDIYMSSQKQKRKVIYMHRTNIHIQKMKYCVKLILTAFTSSIQAIRSDFISKLFNF